MSRATCTGQLQVFDQALQAKRLGAGKRLHDPFIGKEMARTESQLHKHRVVWCEVLQVGVQQRARPFERAACRQGLGQGGVPKILRQFGVPVQAPLALEPQGIGQVAPVPWARRLASVCGGRG